MVDPHNHNGSDAPRVPFQELEIVPSTGISEVSGTADATYSSNEQTLINDLKAQLNAVIAALQDKNIIA